MKRTNCMVCNSENLYEFIDCGDQPNGNNFLYPEQVADEVTFTLSMMVCQDCWEVQISEFPPQELLFCDHPYLSGVNEPVVRHFNELAPRVVNKLGLKDNDLVIDVGCNDGTLLKAFARNGMRVLGVDPSERPGAVARSQGITVFQQFWNHETGKSLKQLGIRPEVITATAVFYHVPDLHDFVAGLAEVMGPNSFFVVQGVNLLDLIEKNEFDHFYHEHSCIHAVAPLTKLFAQHGLRIQDLEFSPIHGGSFILYVCREENPRATTPAVAEAIAKEQAAGLDKLETYKAFSARIDHNMATVRSLLEKLKAEGKTVYALGAPVKGSTVLNRAQIGPDLVEMVTEVNPLKIGRVTPGTHIPVVDEKTLTAKPDYYLVLAWNFIDFLVGKFDDYLTSGGRFIVTVPEVRIIGPKGEYETP
ncbi:class I SAM-dependent methyltransferase [Novosphingobium flavum]|uniref:Class I SAM-dependent methyltransferase n=1 Tax=Novosphingobium flavum TaxID=1778672 RepID=A0A7X1KKF1_9SPHN|nr:class I SAM-dependent methyltransferase [Novosphingobium flavum]MBC2664437.1 class I SAM-dependent methyltransferase [Novosphingobium flavum]